MLQIVQKQFGINNDAVPRADAFKYTAKSIAFSVRKMFFFQQRIAECQPCRDIVFPHKCKHLLRGVISVSDTSSAPDAVCGSTIYRTYIAPFVKIFPVVTKEGKKYAIQLKKFKQSRKMKVCRTFTHILCHTFFRTCLHKHMRTSFRQILPQTALKILAGRQPACGFLPCLQQNYARKSAHISYEDRFLICFLYYSTPVYNLQEKVLGSLNLLPEPQKATRISDGS